MMNHHEKIDELIENMRPSLHKALDKALSSGALGEEITESNDFVLSKMVFTLFMRTEPYRPLNPSHKREMDNLSHFI